MKFNLKTLEIEYEPQDMFKQNIINMSAEIVSIKCGVRMSASLNMIGYGMGLKQPIQTLGYVGLYGIMHSMDECKQIISDILYPKTKLLSY